MPPTRIFSSSVRSCCFSLIANDLQDAGVSSLISQENGARLIKHARYYWLLLAEGHLHRRLFGQMVRRIDALPLPSG